MTFDPQSNAVPNRRTPHWPDHCRHVKHGGTFVGTTVTGDHICDVYLWPGDVGHRQVCIRYGARMHAYQSGYRSPEEWSNPQRVIYYRDNFVLASTFDGPAMELIRAYLEREMKSTDESA